MNGQKLLNTTLRINAAFSFISGIDFIVFDRQVVGIVTGDNHVSIFGLGGMLIGFSIFVFAVSKMKTVNRWLVGAIIAMDALWVISSAGFLFMHSHLLTGIGIFLIGLIAIIIAGFALFQTKGLRQHMHSA